MAGLSLEELFDKFNGLKVLIVGDVMVDSYVFGKVDRMSPEAPVPVVEVDSFETRLGGAGNVALNIKALGAIPILCSAIGEDKEGADLRQVLAYQELTDRALLVSAKRKTTTKTRVIGNKHQLLRIDHEITDPLDTLDSFLLQQHFERELEQADVVIMEDYNKGVLHTENIEMLINLARAAGVPVVVDPKKANFLSYKGATLFKPNLKEIKEGLNLDSDLKDMPSLKEAEIALRKKLGNTISMVTMSERGVFIRDEQEEFVIPAHVRNISDVSGAGDTVVAVAALCLALNVPLRVLGELSNLAGGLVCEETGVVPIDKTKLFEEAQSVIGVAR